jgi:hypothetical protein
MKPLVEMRLIAVSVDSGYLKEQQDANAFRLIADASWPMCVAIVALMLRFRFRPISNTESEAEPRGQWVPRQEPENQESAPPSRAATVTRDGW